VAFFATPVKLDKWAVSGFFCIIHLFPNLKSLFMNKIDALLDILYKIYAILKYLQLRDAVDNPPDESLQMTRQQVKDYLKISESTYKRKVRQGALTPVKMPGGDRFYKYQLEDELKESVRRGRI